MYIKVRVIAKSKKEEVIVEKENYFKIFVKEKAERNMANDRVREIIASHFNVAVSRIRIINGHHMPQKLLSIQGVE